VLHFKPTANASHYFTTESAFVLPHLSPSFGLALSYAHRPLELYLSQANTSVNKVIRHQIIADFTMGLGLMNRFELGLGLPMALLQTSEDIVSFRGTDDADLGSGLGDIRFLPKARIYSVESATISFSMPMSFPTGNSKDFLGEGGVVLSPGVVLSSHFEGLDAALNLAYRIREEKSFKVGTSQNVVIDDEFLLALGLRYPLFPETLDVVLDGRTAIGIQEQDSEEIFAEVLAGVRYYVPDTKLVLNIGGGPGIGRGLGTPAVRLFAHLGWGYEPAPALKDPVAVSQHGVGERSYKTGERVYKTGERKYEKGERIYEAKKPKPKIDKPKPAPVPKKDLSDRDGDGTKNEFDLCPDKPEDKDGFQDKDGCPDLDNDGDGIPDKNDKCPNESEGAFDGFKDDDGCPDPDNDGDGFLDEDDVCPVLAEIVNGFRDNDGCPDKVLESQVKLDRAGIQVPKIHFYSNSAKLKDQTKTLLDKLAKLITENGWLKKIRIEGHTDNRNSYKYNMKLSTRRARAVVNYLVQKGLSRSRFDARGYGEGLPIADNGTEAGRSANRRVVFVIVDPPAP